MNTIAADPVEMEGEITDTVQMDSDDGCCSDAKDKMAQSWIQSNNMSPAQGQRLRTQLDQLPCDEFRQMMETIPGTGPGTNMENHWQNIERNKRILDEWDECASRSFSGLFTASVDPFETAWNYIQKNDDLDDIPAENKGGDCYYNCFNHMCRNPEHTLVHAQVTPLMGPLAGRPYGHAFTTFVGEDGQKMVHDPSADSGKGMTMPADMYYLLGQIAPPNLVEYSHEEMLRQIAESEHAGPWDPMSANWMHSSAEDRQRRREMEGEVLDDGEEWDDDDDMIQNALDPMSINPLLQTAEGMMNQGVTQDMSQAFQDQEGRFVIQPELRLDPITAMKTFRDNPGYGHPKATKDFLDAMGARMTDKVPVPMDMIPPHGILSGRKPTEWQDLTIRPLFGQMKNIPGKQNEVYRIPSQTREIAMGQRGRLRGGDLEVKRPYFGYRVWPHTKGLEGMGWFARPDSAGQLTWIEGMEHVPPRNAPMVEDLVIDPAYRRQGLGTDLVDTFRYSLPALFPQSTGLETKSC